MSDVRIGIVGVGNMGSNHAGALLDGKVPGAVLTALCDTDPKKLERFPDVKHFSASAEIIASGEVDAIIVATPHYDHVPIGIATLEAGLHVLIEKPLSVTKLAAQELIDVAKAHPDQIFCSMFNQRTDPNYLKLKEMIDSGELGTINRINWIITNWFRTESYYANGDWRATWGGEGGGVLMNQCPHQIDLWQWLFGKPSKVRAFAQFGRFHQIEVEDDVTAYMEYDNGTTGVFITTTGESPGTNRLEIAAELGKVVIEGGTFDYTRNKISTSEHCRTSDKPFAPAPREKVEVVIEGEGEQHRGIMKNFVAAIRGEAELLAPAVEGIHMVEIANAMTYSALTDATVELPMDAEVFDAKLKSLVEASTFEKKTVNSGAASAEDMAGSF